MRNSEATNAREDARRTLEKTRGERSRARSSRFQRHDVKRNARSELANVRANDSKNAKKNESSRVRKERRKRRTTTEKNKARTNARMTYPWSLGQIQTRQLDYPSPFRFPGSRPPCYSVVRALFFWLFLSAYLRKEKGGRRSGGALGFKVSWINPKERTKKKE